MAHSDVCSTPMAAQGVPFIAVLAIRVFAPKLAKLDHLYVNLEPLHKSNHLPAVAVTTTLSPAATVSLSAGLLLFRSRTLPLCFARLEQLLVALLLYVNS